jgi:hypothetical protein
MLVELFDQPVLQKSAGRTEQLWDDRPDRWESATDGPIRLLTFLTRAAILRSHASVSLVFLESLETR